jgi:hypothetical protein
MNTEQKRAITLALLYVRETKPNDSGPGPADNWTDADREIIIKATPFSPERQKIIKELAGPMTKDRADQLWDAVIGRVQSDDPLFSVEEGCWGIIEDAIHRRGFFASGLSRVWRSLFH